MLTSRYMFPKSRITAQRRASKVRWVTRPKKSMPLAGRLIRCGGLRGKHNMSPCVCKSRKIRVCKLSGPANRRLRRHLQHLKKRMYVYTCCAHPLSILFRLRAPFKSSDTVIMNAVLKKPRLCARSSLNLFFVISNLAKESHCAFDVQRAIVGPSHQAAYAGTRRFPRRPATELPRQNATLLPSLQPPGLEGERRVCFPCTYFAAVYTDIIR